MSEREKSPPVGPRSIHEEIEVDAHHPDQRPPVAIEFAKDVELMERAAKREREAQRMLAERLYRRVTTICRRVLREPSDADDATQLALLEILHSAHTYRGQSRLESWGDRITARTALRFARSRRRPASTELDTLASPVHEHDATDDTPRGVTEYLAALPDAVREVVVLRHVLDCSIEEIAEMTRVSPNTVKDRLVRGRRAMRAAIHRDQVTGAARRGGTRGRV